MFNIYTFVIDLKEAIKMAQPSLRREGFSSVPDVKWADVGGLDSLKQELDRCIVRCIKHPELYKVNLVMKCVLSYSLRSIIFVVVLVQVLFFFSPLFGLHIEFICTEGRSHS